MKKISLLNSPRLQELKSKHRKDLRIKISIFLGLFLVFLIGLSFLSRWEKINIDKIEIVGNKIVEIREIENLIKEKLVGNYFLVFPKTNFLFYPQSSIEMELRNKFQRIKNVSVNDKNLKILEVSIDERTALYLYCGTTPTEALLPENHKCNFMDDEGYVFEEAPYFSGEVYVKFYGQVSSDSYFFKENFKKLAVFQETLKKIGINGTVFYLENTGDIKMFLSSKTKSELGPAVIFKSDSDYDEIIENLQSVLTTEPLQSDFKNKYTSLLYIDLRFGNKVYYKFK
jgi:hypothetical protein